MDIEELQEHALEEINDAKDAAALEALRVKFLGRKGVLAGFFAELPKLKGDERARRGIELNKLKCALEDAIQAGAKALQFQGLKSLSEREAVDVTPPGTRPPVGHLHIT